MTRRSTLPPFDKYQLYSDAVQSPEADVDFLVDVYKEQSRRRKGAMPLIFREDFCAAFANCCAWVKLSDKHVAHGVDLDPEPLDYGKRKYLPLLTEGQRDRLHLHRSDVLGKKLPTADVICAMNFSYYIFKERQVLKKYFSNCLRTLKPGGVIVLDCFGGPKCHEQNEETSEHGDPPFTYYWDQDSYDPLTCEAKFYIHFKRQGEKKRTKVFSYDWRIWAPQELKDLLLECGFKTVAYYWEGATEDGTGDGNFKVATVGEECEAWVAYLVAAK